MLQGNYGATKNSSSNGQITAIRHSRVSPGDSLLSRVINDSVMAPLNGEKKKPTPEKNFIPK